MKAIALFCTFAISISLISAQEHKYSDKELLEMTMLELFEVLGIPGEYNNRYHNIIIPLCEEGVVIFEEKGNTNSSCYKYIGTIAQNAKLARNIIKNRHLFKDGKLLPNAAAQWQIVD